MTALLRDGLKAAPNIREISRATGVEPSSLVRFRDGETSLRLDKADALATYFGFRVVKDREGK